MSREDAVPPTVIQAAERMLRRVHDDDGGAMSSYDVMAVQVINAIWPQAEAHLRALIAAEIRAAADLPGADEFYGTVADGLHAAARIAEGTPPHDDLGEPQTLDYR